jgi:hypothetical protein
MIPEASLSETEGAPQALGLRVGRFQLSLTVAVW